MRSRTILLTLRLDRRTCWIFCRTAGPWLIPSLCAKIVSRTRKWSSMRSAGGVPNRVYRPVQPRQQRPRSRGLPPCLTLPSRPHCRRRPRHQPCLTRALTLVVAGPPIPGAIDMQWSGGYTLTVGMVVAVHCCHFRRLATALRSIDEACSSLQPDKSWSNPCPRLTGPP